MIKLKVIDLYCGAGGSSLGMEQAGHEIFLAVDFSEKQLRTYEANHKNTREVWNKDILKIDPEELPKCDILLGSPPCQSFSVANTSTRTFDMTLTLHWLRLVKAIKPKYWICENVPPLKDILPVGTPYKILNAADYGAPQKRRRIFVGHFPTPRPTHTQIPYVNLFGESIKKWLPMQPHLRYKEEFIFRTAWFGKINGPQIIPTQRPSWTVVDKLLWFAVQKNRKYRKVTPRELSYLQGFPKGYKFKSGKSAMRYAVSNAVPSQITKAIGSAIQRVEA